MSEHMSDTKNFEVITAAAERLSVSPGRRYRAWSLEAKARVVGETFLPGASLALARRGLRNKIVLHQPLLAHYRTLQRCMKMQVRPAKIDNTDAAIDVVRRSILELCEPDHKGDSATLSAWLSNKTADNMRQWIDAHTVLVAIDDDERIAGVAAVRADGVVLLNYVAPEARFKGASKSLMQAIEVWASSRGLEWLALESTATALRFYQSNGWTETGRRQPGFGVTTRNPMRKAVKRKSSADGLTSPLGHERRPLQ